MTRVTSWLAAVAAAAMIVLGGVSAEAAKAHATVHAKARPAAHAKKHKHHKKAKIEVKVVDQSGKPVSGAAVHFHKIVHHKKHHAHSGKRHSSVVPHAKPKKAHKAPKSHKAPHRNVRTLTTNSAGHAAIEGGGRYHVTASKKGLGHGKRTVAVKAGKTRSVTIRLHQKGKKKAHHHKSSGGKSTSKKRHSSVTSH